MTRAKDHLQLVVPQRFYVTQQQGWGDRHVYAGRTRFIPPSLEKFFETRVWPEAAAVQAASATSPDPTASALLAKMKAMWN
jgi:DNA helicase-2/ATP-dependent DNA helicase PcrA